MNKIVPFLCLIGAGAVLVVMPFWLIHNQKPTYLKKASGSWQISVEIPACESGHVIALPPEREGDVVTIYCNQMPVEGK